MFYGLCLLNPDCVIFILDYNTSVPCSPIKFDRVWISFTAHLLTLCYVFYSSYSLEGLAAEVEDGKRWMPQSGGPSKDQRGVQRQDSEERGSLMSLTEEGPQSDLGHFISPGGQVRPRLPLLL